MAVDEVVPGSPVPTTVPPAPRVRGASRARIWIGAVVILGALGFLLTQLGNSATYFKTASEAVRDKASLGTNRFRIEGVAKEIAVEVSNEVDETLLLIAGQRVVASVEVSDEYPLEVVEQILQKISLPAGAVEISHVLQVR